LWWRAPRYKAPAHYQDKIKVFTKIEKIGNASIHFSQDIFKENILLIQSKTTWVCVNKDFRPKAVPKEIKKALSSTKI
jgi:acyl-CoA thioester hydrolase